MSDKITAPEKLIAWAKERLLCGWSADDLIRGMVEVGHPPEYAKQFASEILAPRDAENALSTQRFLATSPSDADVAQFPNTVQLADCKVSVLFALSWPRVILLENLLSTEECDALIEMARPDLKRAPIVDEETGEFRMDDERVSARKNCAYGETPVVAAAEARIAALFGHPMNNQEPMQILYYPLGGEYKSHHDYFDPVLPSSAAILKRGGQRVATVVMYLNDVAEGGGTIFPKLGLEAKPKRGHAVYFESVDEHGQINPSLLHTGAPVIRGEKWIAVKWIRAEPWRNV